MTKLSYSQAVHILGRRPVFNCVAGCQPPAGATPLSSRCGRDGVGSQGSIPSVLCVIMGPSLSCVWWVRCWRWGVWLGDSGDALRACLVCGQRWLCVGGWPAWWVWHPPWALGVGLVSVFVASDVAIRRHCCGVLLCFALLHCVLRCVAPVHACSFGVCCVVLLLCAPLSPLCAWATSTS